MNDKVQLAEAEAAHRANRAQELMRAGVTVVDPARLDVRGDVACGRDVVLDVNVILEGKVQARRSGEGRRELRAARLRDRRRQRGSHQQPGRGRGRRPRAASIGPFARLRPGTRLADGVHVGNFVEVKNSELGAGSKANHLTYLGDTTLGEQGQRRRRHGHLQLRRREQAPHGDRRRRLHRLGHDAGGAGVGRRGRDDRRRLHDHEARARRQAHRGAQPPGDVESWKRPEKKS